VEEVRGARKKVDLSYLFLSLGSAGVVGSVLGRSLGSSSSLRRFVNEPRPHTILCISKQKWIKLIPFLVILVWYFLVKERDGMGPPPSAH